jgi:hypothetical protein
MPVRDHSKANGPDLRSAGDLSGCSCRRAHGELGGRVDVKSYLATVVRTELQLVVEDLWLGLVTKEPGPREGNWLAMHREFEVIPVTAIERLAVLENSPTAVYSATADL